MSKTAVIEALKYLVSNGYLIKESYVLNGVSRVKYKYSADKLIELGIIKSVHEKPTVTEFFTIYDWMINRLCLSGHELTTYALLYSFRDSDDKALVNTFAYIAERINASELTARRCISRLESQGCISYRAIHKEDGSKKYFFRANSAKEINALRGLEKIENECCFGSKKNNNICVKSEHRNNTITCAKPENKNIGIVRAEPKYKSNIICIKPKHENNNIACLESEYENISDWVKGIVVDEKEKELSYLLTYILASKTKFIGYSLHEKINPNLVEQLRDFRDNVSLVLIEYDSMGDELPAFFADAS